MGIKALRRIQMGNEGVAPGGAVVASMVWRGVGTIQDNRDTVFTEEDVGYLGGLDRTSVTKLEAGLTFESTPASYEMLPYIISAGVQSVAGVQDGGGTGYLYSYAFPTTAVNTLMTYTIEGGDDIAAEEMEYSFVSSFNLSGTGGEALMMTADWIGRQVSTSAFTGGPLVPMAVDEIMMSQALLYIDTVAGGIGGTPVADTLLGMSLDVNTGIQPVYAAENALYFSFTKQTGPEVLLNVTFEHNAAAVAQKVLWRAETPRQIRVQFVGPALATPAAENNKRMTIDMAGLWESFDKIGEQNGNDIINGVFRARYNATAALFCEIVIVNELGVALP